MVGEFSILIAIVILGGALIKILADMRSNADRQIKFEEALSSDERAQGHILVCCSMPVSDCEIAWLDEDWAV